VNCAESVMSASELSATYAGFARAFQYSDAADAVIGGSEYLEVFDPSISDEAASLHEAAYVAMDASALFEELVRFYEHFGLRRNSEAELPDHLCVELEFMHFLCELEGHQDQGSDGLASIHNAQRDFLERHVKRLLDGIGQKLADRDGIAMGLVSSCAEFVELHRQMLAGEA